MYFYTQVNTKMKCETRTPNTTLNPKEMKIRPKEILQLISSSQNTITVTVADLYAEHNYKYVQ